MTIFSFRYDDTLVVPIIENTPEEKDLKERMARALEKYPESCAVLVRRHGVYVWGETWEKAKTMWVQFGHMVSFAIIPQSLNNDLNVMCISNPRTMIQSINFWPHWMYKGLLSMGSFMIPPHGFPFISMLADGVANIFLSYGQVLPHMIPAGNLCFHMTLANAVSLVFSSPIFGTYFLICWWKCSKSGSCSKKCWALHLQQ